jgi:hypothetical protein
MGLNRSKGFRGWTGMILCFESDLDSMCCTFWNVFIDLDLKMHRRVFWHDHRTSMSGSIVLM